MTKDQTKAVNKIKTKQDLILELKKTILAPIFPKEADSLEKRFLKVLNIINDFEKTAVYQERNRLIKYIEKVEASRDTEIGTAEFRYLLENNHKKMFNSISPFGK